MSEEVLYQKYTNHFQKYFVKYYDSFFNVALLLGLSTVSIYLALSPADSLVENIYFVFAFFYLLLIMVFIQKNQVYFISTLDGTISIKTVWGNNITIPLYEIQEFRNYTWSYEGTAYIVKIITKKSTYTATVKASQEEQYTKIVSFLRKNKIPEDNRNPLNQPLFFRKRKK
jgi:hypothetical protein